jgi:hypothetical protein
MGLVVTLSPSLNLGDPLIKPVIDESLFFFQFTRAGTPRGTAAFFGPAAFFGACIDLVACFLIGAGVFFFSGNFFAGKGIDAPFGAK